MVIYSIDRGLSFDIYVNSSGLQKCHFDTGIIIRYSDNDLATTLEILNFNPVYFLKFSDLNRQCIWYRGLSYTIKTSITRMFILTLSFIFL